MPTPLINFADAVTASNLDPNQTHAVYYADGAYANRTAVANRCPHAKLFGITVGGLTGSSIFACDSETGDLTVPQTEGWVARQIQLGVKLICVYANLNRWENEGLLAALSKYGHRIKRWVADFDNVPTIPSWADAKQFADPGPVDRNVALANFFGDDTPAPAVKQASVEVQVSVPMGTTGHLNVLLTYNATTGEWTHHAVPGSPHWSGPGGGAWRTRPLEWDAPPLGK